MKKKDNNGKQMSKEHIRKFVDAVKWGSAMVKQNLPKVFYAETDAYLAAYKKEFAGAKKKGLTDETAADPMCSVLYLLILAWSLAESNVFVWVWMVLQWNCMARSINIDPLSLHNFGGQYARFWRICWDLSFSQIQMTSQMAGMGFCAQAMKGSGIFEDRASFIFSNPKVESLELVHINLVQKCHQINGNE